MTESQVLTYKWFQNEDSLIQMCPHLLLSAVKTYQAAFAEEPWNEYFSEEDVLETFHHLATIGDLGFAIIDSQVIGFAGGYQYQGENTYYIDELAINPSCQGKGYASLLLQEFMIKIATRVDRAVLRTSARHKGAMSLYTKFGFTVTGKSEIEYQMRQDGQIKLDERVYLCNDFRLNRVVVAKRDDLVTAFVFDNCSQYNRMRLQNRIQTSWLQKYDSSVKIDLCCFISVPENPEAMVKMEFMDTAECRLAEESCLILMTQGKDYSGFYQVTQDESSGPFASTSSKLLLPLIPFEIVDGQVVGSSSTKMEILYDGRFLLY